MVKSTLEMILTSISATDVVTKKFIELLYDEKNLQNKSWITITGFDKILQNGLRMSKEKDNFCYDKIVECIDNIEQLRKTNPIIFHNFFIQGFCEGIPTSKNSNTDFIL